MILFRLITHFAMGGIFAAAVAPSARAADAVTYEVVSNDVATADVEYFDLSQRKVVVGVPLPWRTNVAVVNAHGTSTDGAEVRADWRSSIAALPVWRPSHWVTVRIYYGAKIICENTLDVGNATCYGSTPFRS